MNLFGQNAHHKNIIILDIYRTIMSFIKLNFFFTIERITTTKSNNIK
jgi:hypothetical protein